MPLTNNEVQNLVQNISYFSPDVPFGTMRVAAFSCNAAKGSPLAAQIRDPTMPRKLTVVTQKTAQGTKFYLVDVDTLYLPMAFLFATHQPGATVETTNWHDIVGMKDIIKCVSQIDATHTQTQVMIQTTKNTQTPMRCELVDVANIKRIIRTLYERGYHLEQIVVNADKIHWQAASTETDAPKVGCREDHGPLDFEPINLQDREYEAPFESRDQDDD